MESDEWYEKVKKEIEYNQARKKVIIDRLYEFFLQTLERTKKDEATTGEEIATIPVIAKLLLDEFS